eukprot:3512022-Amphidinium_carterae.1
MPSSNGQRGGHLWRCSLQKLQQLAKGMTSKSGNFPQMLLLPFCKTPWQYAVAIHLHKAGSLGPPEPHSQKW